MQTTKAASVLEHLFNNAATGPQRLCLADTASRLSYGEMARLVAGYSEKLRAHGLRPGQRVLLVSAQSVFFLAAFFAVQLAGGIAVPLEKRPGPARLTEVARLCGAGLLLGGREAPPKGLAHLPLPTATDAADYELSTLTFPATSDTTEILFTTGTTGREKGIEMGAAASVAIAENVIRGVGMRPGNVEWVPMPLNHSFSLRRCYANFVNHSAVLLSDGVVMLAPVRKAMAEHGACAIAMAPAAAAAILKLDEALFRDFSFDYIQLGTAPLPQALKQRLCALLPGTRLYNFYGSTEAGCSCVVNYNGPKNQPHSIGMPAVNSSFIFVDEAGRPITPTPEHPGLLATGGPTLMKGYYGDAELTAAVLREGHVYSEDLAYTDAEGTVYLLGRRSDVINVGGQKVAPQEVEEAAAGFAALADCACLPAPDEVAGQVPVLCVVPKAGATLEARALLRHLAERLEPYKVPRRVIQVAEIPRTFNGKIARAALSAQLNTREES